MGRPKLKYCPHCGVSRAKAEAIRSKRLAKHLTALTRIHLAEAVSVAYPGSVSASNKAETAGLLLALGWEPDGSTEVFQIKNKKALTALPTRRKEQKREAL